MGCLTSGLFPVGQGHWGEDRDYPWNFFILLKGWSEKLPESEYHFTRWFNFVNKVCL